MFMHVLAGHEADRLVDVIDAAGELGGLRDLRVLALVERDRDGRARRARRNRAAARRRAAFGVIVTVRVVLLRDDVERRIARRRSADTFTAT